MSSVTSHYTVLARRFRPQTFDDVVGQEHVAQSLKNAIQAGRVAHGYLFTGARGVGKTSMARIFAKALNCPHARDAVPCNECEICQGITAGNDVDVLEIDGASNRGIDDIRTLRANVNVKSMRTKYKVYIIDEVHMLTKEAFNALLKTLEEPPPNVKFVFCTTEPNKVPDTILSRCQRFDFATIEVARISQRLREIAAAEGVDVEPSAVELVARRAAGSMRDSQSLFDQVLAFGGETVTANDVHRLLGTADDDRLMQIASGIVERDHAGVLKILHDTLTAGVQLEELVDQLIAYFRDLMVISTGSDSVPLMSISATNRGTLDGQSQRLGLKTILAGLEILAETKSKMYRVNFGRALVESALVRLCLLEDLQQLEQLVQQLQAIPPSEASQPRTHSPSAAQKKNIPVQSEPHAPELIAPEPVPSTAIHVVFCADNLADFWSQVLYSLEDRIKDHLVGVNETAILGPNQLAVYFPKSYHFSMRFCEKPENLGQIEASATSVAGQPIKIQLKESREEPESESAAEAAAPERQRELPNPDNDPYVRHAIELFQATVAKVQPARSPGSREE